MLPASLLPGPVLGAAGPLGHSIPRCGFPQAYAQGLSSLAMPSPAGLWFLHIPFLAFCFIFTQQVRHSSQRPAEAPPALDVPPLPNPRYRGGNNQAGLSHAAPNDDPAVPL